MHITRIIPDSDSLDILYNQTPEYMHPSRWPYGVIFEDALTEHQCDSILNRMMEEEPYNFRSCGGETRELEPPLEDIFNPVIDCLNFANDMFWQFEISNQHHAWLQTYVVGATYEPHADNVPGQTRKLTAVVMLTDPAEYEGGMLSLIPYPVAFEIPRSKGTVVIFPGWVIHEVHKITHGVRQSLNLGAWGPPFK